MKKSFILTLLGTLLLLLSSCGPSSVPETPSMYVNRAVSCHYSKDLNFVPGLQYYSDSFATAHGLETEYLGYVVQDISYVRSVHIDDGMTAGQPATTFVYKGSGGSFEITLAAELPKYVAAVSHRATAMDGRSAVVYRYGDKLFARFKINDHEFELSSRLFAEDEFYELLCLVCPVGATASEGQMPGEIKVAKIGAYFGGSAKYTPDSSLVLHEACSQVGMTESFRGFTVTSAELRDYYEEGIASDYVLEYAHSGGGTATVYTSAQKGLLPRTAEIGSDSEWSLGNFGRGQAIVFQSGSRYTVRIFSLDRYYEVKTEGIDFDDLQGLIVSICG